MIKSKIALTGFVTYVVVVLGFFAYFQFSGADLYRSKFVSIIGVLVMPSGAVIDHYLGAFIVNTLFIYAVLVLIEKTRR